MEDPIPENPTPTNGGEPTPETNPTPAPVEDVDALKRQISELQAQKEHWRNKYERDVPKQPLETSAAAPSDIPDDAYSDEGRTLKSKIDALQSEIGSLKSNLTLRELQATNPVLKDKADEFDEFRNSPENKGMSLATAAKAFLIEKGLVTPAPTPKRGVESPTAGDRTPQPSGMSASDIENLRKNNWEKYLQLVREGKIRSQE